MNTHSIFGRSVGTRITFHCILNFLRMVFMYTTDIEPVGATSTATFTRCETDLAAARFFKLQVPLTGQQAIKIITITTTTAERSNNLHACYYGRMCFQKNTL